MSSLVSSICQKQVILKWENTLFVYYLSSMSYSLASTIPPVVLSLSPLLYTHPYPSYLTYIPLVLSRVDHLLQTRFWISFTISVPVYLSAPFSSETFRCRLRFGDTDLIRVTHVSCRFFDNIDVVSLVPFSGHCPRFLILVLNKLRTFHSFPLSIVILM